MSTMQQTITDNNLTDADRVKLIEEAYWLVSTTATKAVITDGLSRSEMESALAEELCRCAERFDPNKGVKFSTYAQPSITYCAKHLTQRAAENNNRLVSLDQPVSQLDDGEDLSLGEVTYNGDDYSTIGENMDREAACQQVRGAVANMGNEMQRKAVQTWMKVVCGEGGTQKDAADSIGLSRQLFEHHLGRGFETLQPTLIAVARELNSGNTTNHTIK